MANKVLKTLCVLFVLPLIIVSSCSGCGNEDAVNGLKSEFKADFSCEYNKMNIEGTLTCNGKKLMSVTVDSPQTISGLSFVFKNSELEISRGGAVCTADEAYLPSASFPNVTREIFLGISEGRASFGGKLEELFTYSMTTTWGEAVISSDNLGKILSVCVKNVGYSIELSNVVEP